MKESGDDKVFNGANDDASGITAVITLAEFFKKKNDNARTLIFVAFKGEETVRYVYVLFSNSINSAKNDTIFNLVMLGNDSKLFKL